MHSKLKTFLLALWLCFAKFVSAMAGQVSLPSSRDMRSRQLQSDFFTVECESPYGPILENWFPDTSSPDTLSPTGKTCYYSYSECCGPLLNITNCSNESEDPWPGAFVNGVCSGYSEYNCCYAENGYTVWEFSGCKESDEKIFANWDNNTNTCPSTSVSDCCGKRTEYTSCKESSQPFPGKWNNNVCSGFESDCCFTEDYVTKYNFIACYEDQEKIEGAWRVDGDCYATLLSYCCQSKNPDANPSISAGQRFGIAMGGVTVVAAMIAAVRRRHKSCSLCGKMNGSGNHPPTGIAVIPAKVEESEAGTESTNNAGGGGRVHHHFSTMANVISSMSNAASTVESVSNSINNAAQIASMARGGPLEDLETVEETEEALQNAENGVDCGQKILHSI